MTTTTCDYPITFHAHSIGDPAVFALELREYRLQRLLALLRRLGPYAEDLLELVRGVNLGELPAFLDAIREFRSIPGEWTDTAALKGRTLSALRIFAAWAKLTPGDRDDVLANTLSNWLTTHEAVLDFVAGLLGAAFDKWLKVEAARELVASNVMGELTAGMDQGRPLTASEVFGELTIDLRAADADTNLKALAVDWGLVLDLARQLFEIILVLLQSRK